MDGILFYNDDAVDVAEWLIPYSDDDENEKDDNENDIFTIHIQLII